MTGDDNGHLKLISVEKKQVEKLGRPTTSGDALTRLCWSGPLAEGGGGPDESQVTLGHSSGAVEAKLATTGKVLRSLRVAQDVRHIEVFGGQLFTASASGSACVVREWCGAPPETQAEPIAEAQLRRIKLPGPLADAKLDPLDQGRVAFGGEENALKIWDLEKGMAAWTAKGVCNNIHEVAVPNLITVVQWGTPAAPGRSLLMTGSRDARLRLFDAGRQRKPLCELELGKGVFKGSLGYAGIDDPEPRPLNCSALAFVRGQHWSLFVGNTMGILAEYDLRKLPESQYVSSKPGRKAHLKEAQQMIPFRRGYRGMMGAIRAVSVHPSGDHLVAVGLGRFAYQFGLRERDAQSKVFLKQKLCSVLMSAEAKQKPKGSSDNEGEEAQEGREEEAMDADNGKDDALEEGFSSDEGVAPKPGSKRKRKGTAGKKGAAAAGDSDIEFEGLGSDGDDGNDGNRSDDGDDDRQSGAADGSGEGGQSADGDDGGALGAMQAPPAKAASRAKRKPKRRRKSSA